MLSHSAVEDAEHMNAQARMCACQLRLHFFSRLRTVASGHPSKRRQVVALYPGCSDPIRNKTLGCAGPRRLWFPLPSSRLGCGDPDPLGPPPPVRPALGAGLRSCLLDSGVVPVPRLSRGRRPHNEREARGVLAHMERVPPGARAGALHRIPRTPLLLSYRRERHGVVSRSRASSLSPWGILPLEPLRLEC